MPELPDITVYCDVLRARVVGHRVVKVRVKSPFLLRTFNPPIDEVEGKVVEGVERLGKRVVLGLEGELFVVIRLMIAGRLLWGPPGWKQGGRITQATMEFGPGDGGEAGGVLAINEAGTQRRASLHVVRGRRELVAMGRGRLDVFACTSAEFAAALSRENHTLKRTLTDPSVFDGIGNAYSDEILHAAGLSPLKLTRSMSAEEASRLHEAARSTLAHWTAELRREFDVGPGKPGRFPGVGEITAFRPGFAVHGKFKKACFVCGDPVQRISYAENETNYCATCQTGGKVLADRSMSRLLKDDWPRTIEEWERM
ncbi:MAG: DNA-formamidopyrimidine glycosylase family protein [Planctomycetota bacterium]